MAKYREVPKSLGFFNSDDLSEDTGLISPELLFEDFENENLFLYLGEIVALASPESLFGKSFTREIKLKSPDELFARQTKQHKNLSVKKDKKSGK